MKLENYQLALECIAEELNDACLSSNNCDNYLSLTFYPKDQLNKIIRLRRFRMLDWMLFDGFFLLNLFDNINQLFDAFYVHIDEYAHSDKYAIASNFIDFILNGNLQAEYDNPIFKHLLEIARYTILIRKKREFHHTVITDDTLVIIAPEIKLLHLDAYLIGEFSALFQLQNDITELTKALDKLMMRLPHYIPTSDTVLAIPYSEFGKAQIVQLEESVAAIIDYYLYKPVIFSKLKAMLLPEIADTFLKLGIVKKA